VICANPFASVVIDDALSGPPPETVQFTVAFATGLPN
jgi:hypothetical protein